MNDLPIHAAGIYDPLHRICVSDYVVSSYAPMLSMLLPPNTSDNHSFILNSPQTLVIGQADAQGVAALPGTITELKQIRQICGRQVITVASLEGEQANIDNVVSALRSAELVHIASHGQQIESGFDSGLILYDGRLQISELIRQRVPLGKLVFLSACETAKGEKFDYRF